MLKIGDFSKLSRVSVRMLRYYDEIGLLKPAEIDRFTDYRYYSEAQLPTVCRITALRDMGFGLSTSAPSCPSTTTANGSTISLRRVRRSWSSSGTMLRSGCGFWTQPASG